MPERDKMLEQVKTLTLDPMSSGNQLARFTAALTQKTDEGTIAACNLETTELSTEQIRAARTERFDDNLFADAIELIFERFERKPDPKRSQFWLERLEAEMGWGEFLAAFQDSWTQRMHFADFIPYVLQHVKRQRENGPDLWNKIHQEQRREAGVDDSDDSTE